MIFVRLPPILTKRWNSSNRALEEAIRQGRTNMEYIACHPPKPSTFLKSTGFTSRPDLWVIAVICGAPVFLIAGIIYWSLSKMEVQINRSRPHRSIEWEEARDNYIGKAWTLTGKKGLDMSEYKKRIPELDLVQDEMAKGRAQKEAKMDKKGHH